MYLIKGKKVKEKGILKNAFQVAMTGVRAGEQRSSKVVYALSEVGAAQMVDGLVSVGAIDSSGKATLNRVNTGILGVMTVTKVVVTHFDENGQGRKIRLSKIAEMTGDVDGFWTEGEAKKARKTDKRRARKEARKVTEDAE